MIQVILGEKGSGKTKRLIDMTRESAINEQGLVVFIDDDKRYMYDLPHQIRFVDASEYVSKEHRSCDWFLGFVGGMMAANFDIGVIYVDAFLKLTATKNHFDELQFLFEKLHALGQSGDHKVTFVLSVSANPTELPAFITSCAI